MASGSNRNGGKNSRTVKKRTAAGRTGNRKRNNNDRRRYDDERLDDNVKSEIYLIVLLAFCILLFFCDLGIGGAVGGVLRNVFFGIFGFISYALPIIIFIAASFGVSNSGNKTAMRKLVSSLVLCLLFTVFCELALGGYVKDSAFDIGAVYSRCSCGRSGGGIIGSLFAWMLVRLTGRAGAVVICVVITIICVLLITGKALFHAALEKSREIRDREAEYDDDQDYDDDDDEPSDDSLPDENDRDNDERGKMRRQRLEEFEERRRAQREEKERTLQDAKEQKERKAEADDNERILSRDYTTPVRGITSDTRIRRDDLDNDDIHEIVLDNRTSDDASSHVDNDVISSDAVHAVNISAEDTFHKDELTEEMIGAGGVTLHKDGITIDGSHDEHQSSDGNTDADNGRADDNGAAAIPQGSYGAGDVGRTANTLTPNAGAVRPSAYTAKADAGKAETGKAETVHRTHAYIFPPLNILTKGIKKKSDDSSELKATAVKLENTLKTFGVDARVTDVSQGPSVTRYELHPESGVKVSKIVGLSDDIKLNLAATDIRIEAPIPGKAAVGIEVPNKENSTVALRDLLESKTFKEFPSKLSFAVGKDIGGQIVVADIAKMPHMLIAGATGSGKSVCINTIIMSILYKAKPDEVKLIMIDPKVVELSVYNGIPHLIIPVVTDPKKAAGALQWGVAEMTDRYQKFADMNVRDLKGYNRKVESMRDGGDESAPDKLPQIVIIVDELADLMMVSPGEVEESICRLAQLARAAGIHLIIATQRPSVDVITGLIKANMPSRVAFAVSSGVDSRTILDMNGAEKLLGKGDMLFYPQGYPKPSRIQGAFVSDKEVQDVVSFITKNSAGDVYDQDVENKIKDFENSSGNSKQGQNQSSSTDDQGPDIDQLFQDAGSLIIDKDKASIGMLQRVFKIGFNRAARIMDQLAQYGVVSEEDGTKPRNVLMSAEAFEKLMEQLGSGDIE